MFDLKSAKPAQSVNFRQGQKRGQNFKVKYRKQYFILSEALFQELGLEENAARILEDANSNVALKIVSNDEGQIFKRTGKTGDGKKGRSFKSDVVTKLLTKTGLITDSEENQYLDLKKVADGVYALIAGSKLAEIAPKQDLSSLTTESPAPEEEVIADGSTAPVIEPVEPATEDLLGFGDESAEEGDETPEESEDTSKEEKGSDNDLLNDF